MTARGVSDAFDATDKFPGACLLLTNLVFDQANPEIMVSRPGVSQITDFSSFTTPGVISVSATIGGITYGMISSGLNANKDQPFAYDHNAGAFLAVSGITNPNTPTTQATSGPWVPPTMASVGTLIYVTHPGFPGAGTMFGVFDISVPGAPAWSAGDTGTHGLPSVPSAVSNFGNRAYFACGNTTPYTDVLANNRTSASQALTVGDASDITAFFGLPIQTTSSGIVQALLVFKDFQVWQITGDSDSSNLALNFISLTFGTRSPRSLAGSPLGVYFASGSGPMIVDQLGVLRAVTYSGQQNEPDLHVPWQNVTTPSRICGSYSGTVYRVCMETTINGVTATNDYWFDEHKRRWSGPHSFPYDNATQFQDYFVLVSNANPAMLIKSEIDASGGSVYTDLGSSFMCTEQTATFPKTGEMEMHMVAESTIELASAQGAASYSITALDDLGNALNNCSISVLPSGSLWGSGVWGGFNWASSTNVPTTYNVPWTAPLVFKKMAIYISATASTQLAIGTFFARYKKLGYVNVR
jgi:hypothetical protein